MPMGKISMKKVFVRYASSNETEDASETDLEREREDEKRGGRKI